MIRHLELLPDPDLLYRALILLSELKKVGEISEQSILQEAHISLYSEYLLERSEDKIFETSEGFATYRMLEDNKICYIIDIYVRPEFRNKRAASEMADQIVDVARSVGARELIGTVCPSAKKSTESLKVLLGYGMKLKSAGQDVIVFTKEI
jgi:hypothetical protein